MKKSNEVPETMVVEKTPTMCILDYLKLMSNNSSINTLSVKEIWNKIANKSSLSDMGFSTDEELSTWIQDNPYSSIS